MSFHEDTHDLIQRDIIERPVVEQPWDTTQIALVNGIDTHTQESDR